ncbi:MAG: hypothetical protein AAF706_03415 [Bacteroidota bacterium]
MVRAVRSATHHPDQTHPTLVLKGITDAHKIKELIRQQAGCRPVEVLRTQKGVHEID